MRFDVVVSFRDGSDFSKMVACMSRDRVDRWVRSKASDPNIAGVSIKHPSGISQAFWFASPNYRAGSRGDGMI